MIAFSNQGAIKPCVTGPQTLADAEFLVMVGLPAAGKSTWAEKKSRENPEKRYNILGTNLIMEKMKVMGLGRKGNYAGRWDSLITKACKVLNELGCGRGEKMGSEKLIHNFFHLKSGLFLIEVDFLRTCMLV